MMPDPLLSLVVAALIGGIGAFFFWPERGAFWRWQRTRQMPLMAYSPIDQGALARHAKLADLAARRGVTPAQLALAWMLSQPGVMAIPKSSDPDRLRHNWQAAALRLEGDELAQLDRLFPPPRRKQPLAVG